MKRDELTSLIDDDFYQVFLFGASCPVPYSFALHPWLVISKKGVLSRWEILMSSNACGTSWGHLHLNYADPTDGMNVFRGNSRFRWESKMLGSVKGGGKSNLLSMIELIESSPQVYPFNYEYSRIGPNSNTYVQWVLNQFPELNLKLPFNSFGKNYKFE